MHRLTAAAAALITIAACTGDSSTTSAVVDQASAPEATEPLPTDVSDLPGRLVVVGDDGNIVTMKPDGTDSTNITEDGGVEAGYRQPAFSPVSETVVWSEINAEGSGLGSSDGQGENRVSLPMTAPPFYMFWSPDGNGIGVLHNGVGGTIEFEVVDVGATTSEVLSEGSSFYFSWSPDSSQVAAHVQPEFFGTIALDGEEVDLGATTVATRRLIGSRSASSTSPKWGSSCVRPVANHVCSPLFPDRLPSWPTARAPGWQFSHSSRRTHLPG